MKLIVGLGNPGGRYIGTRHNLGFETLDYFLKKYEPLEKTMWEYDNKSNTDIRKLKIKDTQVILAKPQTYMNKSGVAVANLLSFYKIKTLDLLVIHDELDLPLGKIKIRFGGGAAGHNGVESVMESIGTDKFVRIRMGIGKPTRSESSKFENNLHEKGANHVLERFSDNEMHKVKNMIKQVQKNLELLLEYGYEDFISKFNVKS